MIKILIQNYVGLIYGNIMFHVLFIYIHPIFEVNEIFSVLIFLDPEEQFE